jgi:hypothetical protein
MLFELVGGAAVFASRAAQSASTDVSGSLHPKGPVQARQYLWRLVSVVRQLACGERNRAAPTPVTQSANFRHRS